MSKIEIGKRYFVKMRPLRVIPIIGWAYTTTSDMGKWVECEVVEIEEDYKLKLQSIEEGYGSRSFYCMDFEASVRNGYIIEKTRPDQHVELITWREMLTPTVPIEHSMYVVV